MSSDDVYRHRLSVRFRDCDAMGHVNHAVYFTYFEQCRAGASRPARRRRTPE
jgi:acyl-CoA thioesterase FadM